MSVKSTANGRCGGSLGRRVALAILTTLVVLAFGAAARADYDCNQSCGTYANDTSFGVLVIGDNNYCDPPFASLSSPLVSDIQYTTNGQRQTLNFPETCSGCTCDYACSCLNMVMSNAFPLACARNENYRLWRVDYTFQQHGTCDDPYKTVTLSVGGNGTSMSDSKDFTSPYTTSPSDVVGGVHFRKMFWKGQDWVEWYPFADAGGQDSTFTLRYAEYAHVEAVKDLDGTETSLGRVAPDWHKVGDSAAGAYPGNETGYVCTGASLFSGGMVTEKPGLCSGNANLSVKSSTLGENKIVWRYKTSKNLTMSTTRESGSTGTQPTPAQVFLSPQQDGSAHAYLKGSTQTVKVRKISAGPTAADRWRLVSYTVTQGAAAAITTELADTAASVKATDTLEFTIDMTYDTTIGFEYRLEHSVVVSVNPQGGPNGIVAAAMPEPATGTNWLKHGQSVSLSALDVVTVAPSEYKCESYVKDATLTPLPAGQTCADATALQGLTLSAGVTIEWRYKKAVAVTVAVEGVDQQDVDQAVLSPILGTTKVPINTSLTLTAPASFTSGDGSAKYFLQRWRGTGSIGSATSAATTGTVSAGPYPLTGASGITWVYAKHVRLKVDTLGLAPPSGAKATECLNIDYLTCVGYSNTTPLGSGAVGSSGTGNYYPIGSTLVLTALEDVTEGAAVRKNRGTILVEGMVSGESQNLASGRRTTSFTLVGPVSLKWNYTNADRFFVGQETINKPADASDDKPSVVVGNMDPGKTAADYFFWAPFSKKLYPLRPCDEVTITWKKTDNSEQTQEGFTVWPAESTMQTHVANVRVNLQPAAAPDSYLGLLYTTGDATVGSNIFNATGPQKSVLMFTSGGRGSAQDKPVRFVIARTYLYNDAFVYQSALEPCTVGTPITYAGHSDPEGKTGYVYHELANYDGVGVKAALQRDTRTGTILPVNTTHPDPTRALVVVWFNSVTSVGWPVKSIRYECSWPANPEKIVIAEGNGWKVDPPASYPDAAVYVQNDPALAGFNPNEEHAFLQADAVYALRTNFNTSYGYSQAYALLKHKDAQGKWTAKVLQVAETDATHSFTRPIEAGQPINPFPPLFIFPPVSESALKSGAEWYFKDVKGGHWAKAQATPPATSQIVMNWYYPLQEGFWYPGTAAVGDSVPFMGYGALPPKDVTYTVAWPASAPLLRLGETAMSSTPGLPDFGRMAAAEIVYDQSFHDGGKVAAKLFEPLAERRVSLAALPAGIATENEGGKLLFPDLPYFLKQRFFYDPIAKQLVFRGVQDSSGVGEPLLLINVMSPGERTKLTSVLPALAVPISNLFDLSRNPAGVAIAPGSTYPNPFNATATLTGAQWATRWGTPIGVQQVGSALVPLRTLGGSPALTAGSSGATGYVVIAENNDASLGSAAVSLKIVRVGDPDPTKVYTGEIKVIAPDNVFDEKLTLRHSGSFAGDPHLFTFEWYYQPDAAGVSPPVAGAPAGWIPMASGPGLQEVTIEGASPLTLSDNWFIVRYYYKDVFPKPPAVAFGGAPGADPDNWSPFAGAPGNQQAQLAEGWLKRVLAGLNLLDSRVDDFRETPADTMVSMISQVGPWCGTEIALNPSGENLQSVGLLAAYRTLLRRGRLFTVDVGTDYAPANTALLRTATSIADLYMLLGNEAMADSIDPTIGFDTASDEFGTWAPSIFAFKNQLASLLDEELALLRGRDDAAYSTQACPLYNRLIWNFTQAEGEVAYRQTYNITDKDGNGNINEDDAKAMFPQGHGDAWGHYLSALSSWYDLLRSPSFTWVPRTESVLVGGLPVNVDYLDERKFAKAAAAKARAGAAILDLTFKSAYVDDPDGQWQGYKDTDAERAWGVDDWAKRAGVGGYLDWVMANALLRAQDPDPGHTGIQKIDRRTVTEVQLIAAEVHAVQDAIDKADQGMNPLGLGKGVVPFDIDPSLIDAGLTHFEQIYGRAVDALANARVVFDYANQFSNRIRRSEEDVDDYVADARAQEQDYENQLIDLYGYPYSDDIGPGKSYDAGYDGPDWLHFMIVDRTELTDKDVAASVAVKDFTTQFSFADADFKEEFSFQGTTRTVKFPVSADAPWVLKPVEWTGRRRATGELQALLSEVVLADANLKKGQREFQELQRQIEQMRDGIAMRDQSLVASVQIVNDTNGQLTTLEDKIQGYQAGAMVANRIADTIDRAFATAEEYLPKVVGLATDASAPARGSLFAARNIATAVFGVTADTMEGLKLDAEQKKEQVSRNGDLRLLVNDARVEIQQMIQELQDKVNEAEVKVYELMILRQTFAQSVETYRTRLAAAERLIAERAQTRAANAAQIQAYRYQDLSSRIFLNDALAKYRAQLDLALRYAYLAATAYDYETNLLGTDNGAGRTFLTDIFRQRSIGQLLTRADGTVVPVAGQPGIADVLGRMRENFAVLKSQMGFNNPQTETNRFSLRAELFRIRPDAASDGDWTAQLKASQVDDLWAVPEFRRFVRPFTEERDGPQPGIVITFPTTVTFGQNFFGWPLSGGDSAYDPTLFATKVRSVGVWFTGYDEAAMQKTPRVYLVPTGADVLRAPSAFDFTTREWKVLDQVLPVPFELGAGDLASATWKPTDSLSGAMGEGRRFSSFRAYPDGGDFDPQQANFDSRLVGRSVWNTTWTLIIPGGTLLADAAEGLEAFYDSVKDIKLFFQTYSYSGN